jgi:hypothetical protein
MVRREEEGDDPHRVAALGPGKSPQENGIEGRTGPKEEAAMERPAGYFDQGARGRDESESSWHTPE